MGRTVLIACGGALGSVARYWMGTTVQQLAGGAFPIGTIAVNLLGSLLLGLVMALALERSAIGEDGRALLAIGLCGGFTTMSTFSYETLALLEQGKTAVALGNIGATVLGCVLAVWLGIALARAI
jgi:CrcB protein